MRMARRIGFFGMPSGIVLFDKDKGGDQTRVTGGFTGGSGSDCVRITVSSSRIDCYHWRNDNEKNDATLRTTSKIDFAKLKTLYVRRTRTSGWGGSSCNYAIPVLRIMNGSTRLAQVSLGAAYAQQDIALDVTALTGKYTVQIFLGGSLNISQTVHTYITKIWGE